MKLIDTDGFSSTLRARIVRPERRELLITNYIGTAQADDLSEPPNCGGFGRIRHFRRFTAGEWPRNPLPIDPACAALKLSRTDELEAEAFQLAGCNWRCWYCYVPFPSLSANPKYSAWLTADQLVDSYEKIPNRPRIIDLTGGQPDLAPEWVPWTMQALLDRGLDQNTYLWSDDNLSNDFFWRFLSESERELLATYRNYGRVGCFKGYDHESFRFNTHADELLFDRQFEVMRGLLKTGVDIYAYVTLTGPPRADISDVMSRFVDRLQQLHENLPLRTVPLDIRIFSPVRSRMNEARTAALEQQRRAVEAWKAEIDQRFSAADRERAITEVLLESTHGGEKLRRR